MNYDQKKFTPITHVSDKGNEHRSTIYDKPEFKDIDLSIGNEDTESFDITKQISGDGKEIINNYISPSLTYSQPLLQYSQPLQNTQIQGADEFLRRQSETVWMIMKTLKTKHPRERNFVYMSNKTISLGD